MPIGGLRSSVAGNLHADSKFPDTDNIRRERINMAGGENESQNSNQASVASNSDEIRSENPALRTFNPDTNKGAAIFKLKTKNEHEKKIDLGKSNASLFWRLLLAKEPSFGGIISKIPIKFDAGENPTKHVNITLRYATTEIKALQ